MFTFRFKARPWAMWFLPLSFFAYQFVLRLWPSLLMPEIMAQFTIDATAFGFLSAVYYFGYAGFQIPIALGLDYYGPRLVVSSCIFVCACAVLLFAFTESWPLALLGRFLIGVGSAAGFLGTSKVVALWFPRHKYSTMIGLTFSFGLIGALYGGKPLTYLLESVSWKQVSVGLACSAMGLSAMVFLFFQNPERSGQNKEQMLSWQGLKQVFKSPSLIGLAVANLLMVGSLEGFADVWGVNYLMKAYHLPKSEAAGLISFIFVGMLFGGPSLACLSYRWGTYPVIIACSLGMSTLFCFMLWGEWLWNWYGLALLLFCLGILCCYQVLIFEAGSNLVPVNLLSVAVAFLNCINMLGGSFFHTIIGWLMDVFWAGDIVNGMRIYTLQSYVNALFIIPFASMLGGAIVYTLYIRKKERLAKQVSIYP